ncbi:MAG: N-acetyl-gamma-glutamyl-phosphate reductase [Bryobacteraceae bacterium]|nr:N-acetyl-gamma-glutamyl-phosphate reductase [Bryobacteraceae bacterium]MCX7604666.1 N-acetyl-gamma-glutamyl-phosphate reductase [Bryobacteraceae bacterium]
MSFRAGIVGFRGYSGMELARILRSHPSVEPVWMEHRSDAAPEVHPLGWKGPERIAATPEAAREAGLGVVFLATPAEVSMELAPGFLASGIRVVDLSGAFRLKTVERYRRWYGEEHTQPALLEEAVYGLPEFYRDRIAGARLVANPGCYPTAANLALRPLVESGLVDRSHGIVCDAKSGVSGAGRKPSLKTSFCEVTENFSAYSVLGHRHVPEVLMNSGLEEHEFSFTAHLLPIHRGILETIYFRAVEGAGEEALLEAYQKAYGGEPFVRLYPPGSMPDLRPVQHTNLCLIGFRVDAATRRAVVVVCIDNLGKGAAGQAVQNMNLMLGLAEAEGLSCES